MAVGHLLKCAWFSAGVPFVFPMYTYIQIVILNLLQQLSVLNSSLYAKSGFINWQTVV